jgi:hypothetical protein
MRLAREMAELYARAGENRRLRGINLAGKQGVNKGVNRGELMGDND